MPDRAIPHLDASIYALSEPRVSAAYPGWGRDDVIRELYDRRDEVGTAGQLAENKPGSQVLRISRVQLDDSVAWPYGGLEEDQTAEAAIYIPQPFGQLKPAPLWDTTQTCDLNYFEPVGMWTDGAGHNNYWNDQMVLPGLPQPVLIMTNGTPLLSGEYTGLRSRFNVPWNAMMCFALWRSDPPDSDVVRVFSLTALDGDTSYITVQGGSIPETGQQCTVVDTDGTSHTVTVTSVTGIPPSQTGDGTWHYRIWFTPVIAAAAASIAWTETWSPPSNYKYGTQIYFGTTGTRGFCLEIPYNSDAVMWMRDQAYTGNQWKQLRPERGTRLGTGNIYNQQIRAGRDVDYKFIWLAQTANGVAVSTDGFVSNVGFWPTVVEAPSPSAPKGVYLTVPRGPVEFRHNAGAWGLSWLPINYPASMTVDGPVFRLPFSYIEYRDHASIATRFPPHAAVYGIDPRDEDGQEIGGKLALEITNGMAYSRVPDSDNGVEWRATMEVDVQTETFTPGGQISEQQKNPLSTSLNYSHAVAPELHGVMFYGWPGRKTTALGSSSALEVISGEISWDIDSIGATGSLLLPDVPEESYPDGQQKDQFFTWFRPRYITLGGRWLDADRNAVAATDTTIYSGLLAVPDTKGGGTRVTAQILDESVKAVESVSDGRVPPFDGWSVRTAIIWILDHLGIPFDDAEIEDTGLHLTQAAPGHDPLWYAEDGRSWKDLLEEICLFDYMATLFLDGDGNMCKGCYYCHTIRNSTEGDANWAPAHGLHGWTGDACEQADIIYSGNAYGVDRFITLGAAYKSSVPTGAPDGLTHEGSDFQFEGHLVEEEYYNHCKVKGAKHMGTDDPMSVEFTYWPSVLGTAGTAYSLGHKKSQNHTFEWATDYATLYRVGRALYMRHWSAPIYMSVSLPFAPELYPGDVVAVYGAEAERRGVNACRWRVVGLGHKMDRKLGIWRTEIRGRYMGIVS